MNQAEIFETIVRHTREVVPALQAHRFTLTDSLRELGANSVDRADIIMMTLESLALRIPLSTMAKAENIGELASIIHARA
ncbi:acyl carrier protein [Steroidobacter sp. S1-65]|uniref:Acyl carrier protein n=1 Tax=Steroidobacter gossypii TaxID=2805490 RepID=A0ABS1WUD9_9GAMM|nr:acyl carrier protein [Steroidobacter gossypii]MBM0104592.1 acyl carrier protein [Steroidobacter gossypii]